MTLRRIAVVTLSAALLAGTASAQFVQYTPPGSLAVPQTPTKERLELAMKEARWHWGPLGLAPWLAIKDFRYVDNVFGTTAAQKSDFTATVGVGLHGYAHGGGKMILAFHALPEYVWWQDLAERRVWNGRYGAGLFGYFNRLTLEASAGTSRQQQYASSEIEQPVNLRDDRGRLLVELRVFGKLSLVAAGSADRWRYRERDFSGPLGAALVLLDRDEQRLGGGLRYHLSERSSVGVGLTRLETDFRRPERDRSNSGDAPAFQLELAGARTGANADIIFAALDPTAGSEFVPYDRPLGRVGVYVRPAARLTFRLYGSRNLVYSLEDPSPYYEDERLGLSVDSTLGWRSLLRVYAEQGSNRFVAVPGGVDELTDDVETYGAALSFTLGRGAAVVIDASRSSYTSALPGRGRSITQVQSSIQFTGRGAEWW